MRISRTTLSCVLRTKLYGAYLTGATFRDGAEINPRASVTYSTASDEGHGAVAMTVQPSP